MFAFNVALLSSALESEESVASNSGVTVGAKSLSSSLYCYYHPGDIIPRIF